MEDTEPADPRYAHSAALGRRQQDWQDQAQIARVKGVAAYAGRRCRDCAKPLPASGVCSCGGTGLDPEEQLQRDRKLEAADAWADDDVEGASSVKELVAARAPELEPEPEPEPQLALDANGDDDDEVPDEWDS